MADIEVLLHGIPGRTSHGYLSFASAAMIDRRVVVDTGSLARRPLLEKTLDAANVNPEHIEDVLLTHVHYDHSDNVDLFPNATIHVYEPEMRRLEAGELDWATPRKAPAIFADLDVALFEEGDVIEGLRAVHTPGHTEQHVSFLTERDGMTIGLTGDAVKNMREVATRNPMVLYDKEVAIETLESMCNVLDFVVPGHDTPFYITDDGAPIPGMDVDFGLNLQITADTANTTDLVTSRSNVRPMPDAVADLTLRQEFH